MTKHKKRSGNGRIFVGLLLVVLVGLGLLMTVLLRNADIQLFSPKGLMASEQMRLMIFAGGLLLEVALPTVLFLYFTAWKYRETNEKAAYDVRPPAKSIVAVIWLIPCMVVLTLAFVMWPATHRLQPQKSIASNVRPITIQVVAMRWKWLFIYPEQNVASVNFLQIPTGTPIQFDLTADEAPMSSFWIPHLGGQLYAMTGHINRLNLLADKPGDYPGRSAEINGAGFAGMTFTARAGSNDEFYNWINSVKQSTHVLDTASYDTLLAPSENNPAAFYASTEPDLYAKMLTKYGEHTHSHTSQSADYQTTEQE
jgi:cytochrome o ubiquinol oxidase subunit 2